MLTAKIPKIGVAIIGYGGMGAWHGRKLETLECVDLIGTYDIDPQRLEIARENHINTYDSLSEALVDPNVDVVTVAIPNHLHEEICIRAMEAGKHVICEKPVALNHIQLQRMIDTAKQCNVLFTVHQNRRWDEDFRIVKKLWDEKTLGKIFRIESRVHGSRGIPGDWRNQREFGGGMVLDWGVHLLDQILLMVDKPLESVYAQLSYVTNENCDDGFTAQLKFVDDLDVEVQVGTSNFVSLPRWYVLGENGSAIIDNFALDGKIVMVSDWEKRDAVPVVTAAGLTKTMAPRTDETIMEYSLPRVESDVRDFYRNVASVICCGAEPLITHDQVMRVMKLMEAIFESARTNTVIKNLDI